MSYSIASKKEWDIAVQLAMRRREKMVCSDRDLKDSHNFKISRKSNSHLHHSFIVVNNKIYAMSRSYFARGNFSRIKLIQDIEGKVFILKIIPTHMRDVSVEVKALKHEHKYHGHFIHHRGHHHSIWKENGQRVHNKAYLVTDFIRGQTLDHYKFGQFHAKHINYLEIILGLRLVQALKKLHKHHIIHGEIQRKNILIEEFHVGMRRDYRVHFVGFGNARHLSKDEHSVTDDDLSENFGYTAPETSRDHVISYESDVYALGHVLAWDINFRIPMVLMMSNAHPKSRPSLKDVETELICLLWDLEPEYAHKLKLPPLFSPKHDRYVGHKENTSTPHYQKYRDLRLKHTKFVPAPKKTGFSSLIDTIKESCCGIKHQH